MVYPSPQPCFLARTSHRPIARAGGAWPSLSHKQGRWAQAWARGRTGVQDTCCKQVELRDFAREPVGVLRVRVLVEDCDGDTERLQVCSTGSSDVPRVFAVPPSRCRQARVYVRACVRGMVRVRVRVCTEAKPAVSTTGQGQRAAGSGGEAGGVNNGPRAAGSRLNGSGKRQAGREQGCGVV